MKGIVYTEFTEMVEARFGFETLEQIIDKANLPNGGAYTAVGTYDHREIVRLVEQLSAVTGVERRQLLRAFGEHLFHCLAAAHPRFVAGIHGTFALLPTIGPHIHEEVQKLYPDAELPAIEAKLLDSGRMELSYRSSRPFGDLAEGLIRGCIRHFGESIDIERKDLPVSTGSAVLFTLSIATG